MGEIYDKRVFASASFGPTEKARFGVVMLKREERGVALVWFAKDLVLLRLERWERGKKRGVAFVKYMEVTEPLDAREKNLNCISLK